MVVSNTKYQSQQQVNNYKSADLKNSKLYANNSQSSSFGRIKLRVKQKANEELDEIFQTCKPTKANVKLPSLFPSCDQKPQQARPMCNSKTLSNQQLFYLNPHLNPLHSNLGSSPNLNSPDLLTKIRQQQSQQRKRMLLGQNY